MSVANAGYFLVTFAQGTEPSASTVALTATFMPFF